MDRLHHVGNRLLKTLADEKSYVWDKLITLSSKNLLAGTSVTILGQKSTFAYVKPRRFRTSPLNPSRCPRLPNPPPWRILPLLISLSLQIKHRLLRLQLGHGLAQPELEASA
jgi:hypothetical protein